MIEDVIARDEALSQWWTDPRLAAAFVRWAGVRPGMRVIEPGAGIGRIVDALIELGAFVRAIELDERLVRALAREYQGRRDVVIDRADFLSIPAPAIADHCIGNPPFHEDNEARFLEHGARVAGRSAMIMRLHGLAGRDRWDKHYPWVRFTRISVLVPRPPFHGSGMHDICVADVVLRKRRRRAQEHDRIRFGELRWQP